MPISNLSLNVRYDDWIILASSELSVSQKRTQYLTIPSYLIFFFLFGLPICQIVEIGHILLLVGDRNSVFSEGFRCIRRCM
jgi:hypothetical protein